MRMVSDPAADLHGVVRDEAMPAHDQIERALALADPALADDEHAKTEDVHQDGVRPRFAPARESSRIDVSFANAAGVVRGRLKERKARRARPRSPIPAGGVESARDEHAWKSTREDRPQRRRPGGRIQEFENPDLALAKHEQAARPQIFLEIRRARGPFSGGGDR